MAKSPLFAALQRALNLSRIADHTQVPADQVAEWVQTQKAKGISRRDFLQKSLYGSAGLIALTALPGWTFHEDPPATRIAIIGAGMAGLNAAYTLQKHGITQGVQIFEASSRTGGRMMTERLNGNTGTTELGGEFVDSDHLDILALADEFGVQRLLKKTDTLIPELFWIDGKAYTQADAIRAFQAIRKQIAKDYKAKGDRLKTLDNTTLADYLAALPLEPWFRTVLDVAYAGEYGLDTQDQSALNLIYLIGKQPPDVFEMFGGSDEAIKLLGGNQQLCDQLAKKLSGSIRLNTPLTSIRSNGQTFFLTFEGEAKELEFDHVIMTIPFTILRDIPGIDTLQGMTPDKLKCIRELGYGTNGKYFLDMQKRVWRDQGYQGYLYTNHIHTSWDSYHLQNDNTGKSIYSVFFGGQAGTDIHKGGGEAYLDEINTAFPGFKAQYTGYTSQMNWAKHKWNKGSYICPRPGQYTTIIDHIATPIGNLRFAGEHVSVDFGGFMNGAAETGRVAAQQILATLNEKIPAHH